MSTDPLVHVIIPFYNTVTYLAEAIESVLSQSYSNYELLLVDNCSTDGSTDVAERYVARDARVRLVRNRDFLTQVQNYNHALSQLSPKARYCKIVQADDAIYRQCLSEMVALAEANPTVGVVSSYRLVGTKVLPESLPTTTMVMAGREAGRYALLGDLPLFGSPTVVLLRAEIVRERIPFYAEGRYFEDVDVIYELLRRCDFGFVPQILSFIRVDQGSIWGKMESFHPSELAHFMQLRSYGQYYLPPDEHQDLVRACERAYRRKLATAWLRRREPDFWEFHRKGLAEIGVGISRAELVRDAVPVLLHYLLSPEAVALALARRVRQRLGR